MKNSFPNIRSTTLALLATWLVAPILSGYISADGRGVFRVAVALHDSTTYKPIQGAKLTMKDAGAEGLNGHPELKQLLPMLAPKETSDFGDAFVYYYGGFTSETDQNGKSKYRRQVRGILVIEKDGYERLEIDLAKYIGPSFDSAEAIPEIELHMKAKAK